MTAFIRGLFGSKAPLPGESEAKPAPAQKANRQPKESKEFFLDINEARTYGNLEYMQTSKKVKRTFPKTADQPEEMELVQEVSAMDRIVEGQSKPASSAMPIAETKETQPSPTTSTSNEAAERRRTDTSMDMFRNMAKQIRK